MTMFRRAGVKSSSSCFLLLLLLFWLAAPFPTKAFVIRPANDQLHTVPHHTLLLNSNNNNNENDDGFNPLKLLNPYPESQIPDEIRAEIYQAEANTEAARDRGQRVALYTVLAVTLVGAAFFNAFLTTLRDSVAPDTGAPFSLAESEQFSWVLGNVVTQFLFLNKIGGGVCLLMGAGAGLLAEAELDTRRINAEKIYEVMVERREAKEQKQQKKQQRNMPKTKKKKKRKSTKESKRLGALVEVMDTTSDSDTTTTTASANTETTAAETTTAADASAPAPAPTTTTDKKDEGLLDQVKNFYNRADSMAASQALLLNKKLEDAGVLEKITDETGFKVVGKQSAPEDADKTSEATTTKAETTSANDKA